MAKIEKVDVSWNGLLPVIAKLIGEWKPPKFSTEANYRDDLFKFLREHVPDDAKVEKEFRHRGTTMDLWLGWKGVIDNDELAFELKVNLKKKTDYDRLVGQIEGLDPKNFKTIVVLIGKTDEILLGRLKHKYAELLSSAYMFEAPQQMAIITTPTPD